MIDVPVKIFPIADNVPSLSTSKSNYFYSYSRGFLCGVKTFSSINEVFCIVKESVPLKLHFEGVAMGFIRDPLTHTYVFNIYTDIRFPLPFKCYVRLGYNLIIHN